MKYTGKIEITVEADSIEQAENYIAFATMKLSASDNTIVKAIYEPETITTLKQKPDIKLC